MNWKELFTNAAISNYLVFGAGLLVGLFVHFFNRFRKRPVFIELEKQAETNLLSLGNAAAERLKITYGEERVSEFHETVFRVRNKSRRTLENIELKLYLDTEAGMQKFYEFTVNDPLEDLRKPPPEVRCVVEDEEHYLRIGIPYINSHRDNADEISISVYAPKPVKPLRLVGGGKGWGSRFFDRVAYYERVGRLVRDSSSLTNLVINALTTSIFRRRY